MKNILTLIVFLSSLTANAQQTNQVNIIPRPAEILMGKGDLIVSKSTVIIASATAMYEALYLKNFLAKYYGLQLPIKSPGSLSKNSNAIFFSLLKTEKTNKDEYRIAVKKNSVKIESSNNEGLFYGVQSFLQLFPNADRKTNINNRTFKIQQLNIKDHPRFLYRGMHLDVCRHFYPVEAVKKYIDYLALYKFNYFHWHLTDDQGWRIEIKKYPLLTSVGGYRNGTITGRYPGKGNDSLHYGGYYTQVEIKDIVKYAEKNHITIIPEIEMPGHSSAAIAAYPKLSCFPEESTKINLKTLWAGDTTGKQVQQTWGIFEDVLCPSTFTFDFLQDVLDEVIKLFPSPYIHVGGDECPKESWKRSAFCQQLIKDSNLENEHGLQSFFIQKIEKYLNSKGKKIIGWDEILGGGLAPNATVMSWRGEAGGIEAAKQKHDVIMTPESYVYLDHSQSKNEDSLGIGGYVPIEKVYTYEPVSAGLDSNDAKYILGVQGNVWTEYIGSQKKLEYIIFPRMSALSEVAWTQQDKKGWPDFERRLPSLFERYKMIGINYSTAYYDLQSSILPTENNEGVLWKLDTKSKNKININLDVEDSPTVYTKPLLIKNNTMASALIDSINKTITQQFYFNKATGKKITLKNLPAEKYAGSGAFTLVNSVITEKKLVQSSEWLGFLGNDLEATIDLGKAEALKTITLNVLKQEGSWIYLPAYVEFFISDNGNDYFSAGKLLPDSNNIWPDERKISIQLNNTTAKFIKIFAKNYGVIPSGKPGGGTHAWLFADEIEVW